MPPTAHMPDISRMRNPLTPFELVDDAPDAELVELAAEVSVPFGNVPFSTIVVVSLTGPI